MAAAAGSSEFALTCELLRMYMQENQRQQQQAALAGVLAQPPATQEGDGRTMQLFPARAGASPPLSLSLQGPEVEGQLKGTLTIFYGGRVVAFDDFPADKAKELMEMAGSVSSQAPENENKELALELAMPGAAVLQPEEETLVDLPISRKASLQRFLHERKHRTTGYDPYRKATADRGAGAGDSGSGRRGDDEPGPSWLGGSWLGL